VLSVWEVHCGRGWWSGGCVPGVEWRTPGKVRGGLGSGHGVPERGSAVVWRSDKPGAVREGIRGPVTVPRPEVSHRTGHIDECVSRCGSASPSGVGAGGDAFLLDTAGLPVDRQFVRAGNTPGAAAP
jgi:hypothetical protein